MDNQIAELRKDISDLKIRIDDTNYKLHDIASDIKVIKEVLIPRITIFLDSKIR